MTTNILQEESISKKTLPNNIEAEISILGGVLQDNSKLPILLESLSQDDFYLQAHQKIFSAIEELSKSGMPVDILTVANKLDERGELASSGGHAYLAKLVESVPTTANIEYYIKIVKEKSLLRKLIYASQDIITQSMGNIEDTEQFMDQVESTIFRITQYRLWSPYKHIKELVYETFSEIEEAGKKGSRITGVPSGFTDLDNLTAGFQPGDFIIIAGRPSMGKSAFALNIAVNAALRYKKKVMIFSLEMSRFQLVRRMLCSESRIDSSKLRTGKLNKEEWARLIEVASLLSETDIFVDDTPALPVIQMRAKARRLQSEHGVDLIIVDYLQLMKGITKHDSREREISEISGALKSLAKELNVPVIALSQLNRDLERRSDKRPVLADLRESGAIEQDADLILFIYRDEVYNPNTENPNIAEIIIGKQRNGPIGTVLLYFAKEYTRFDNLTSIEKETFG